MLGQKIKIIASPELSAWKLGRLAGREGTITADAHNKKIKGCWVTLEKAFAGEMEWFIPVQSLQIVS